MDGAPAHLGQKIDPETARVEVDGVPLPLRPDLVYVLLNKPRGVVSTVTDPQGRHTVVDLVGLPTRIYPVGRLDADTQGLLILTNDGEFTEIITHPRYEIPKTYLALVAGHPGAAALRKLTEGVELEDGPATAVSARLVDTSGSGALVELVLTEGRKREVRRMMEKIGHPVRRLTRIAIGPLRDRSLRPGEWRLLTMAEVRSLYSSARMG